MENLLAITNYIEQPNTNTQLSRDELFGDGFFTTGVIEDSKIKHLEYHLNRIINSAERLGFYDINFTALKRELASQANQVKDAGFRLTVYRQQTARGYAISQSSRTNFKCMFFSKPSKPSFPCELTVAKTPISVNPMLAGIKHLNRLDNVLAATEITNINQEVIMCDDECVTSGSRSNLFFLINGQWLTPKLDRAGINGITRTRVIEYLNEKNSSLVECRIEKTQLETVQSAFVTNSLFGVWPCSKIGNITLAMAPSLAISKAISV